jgi:hypothetical protein
MSLTCTESPVRTLPVTKLRSTAAATAKQAADLTLLYKDQNKKVTAS